MIHPAPAVGPPRLAITPFPPDSGLIVSQFFATVVVSLAVVVYTVGCFRPFDANCCSAKTLGLGGGVVMVIYVVLQLIAFACAITVKNEGEGGC